MKGRDWLAMHRLPVVAGDPLNTMEIRMRQQEGDLWIDDNGLTVLIDDGKRRLVVDTGRFRKMAEKVGGNWKAVALAFLDAEVPQSAVPHGATWLDDTVSPPVIYRWNAYALAPDGAPKLYGRWERDHLFDALMLAVRLAAAALQTVPKIDEPYTVEHRTAHAYALAVIQAAIAKAEGRPISSPPGAAGSLGDLLRRCRDLLHGQPSNMLVERGQAERASLIALLSSIVGAPAQRPAVAEYFTPHDQ